MYAAGKIPGGFIKREGRPTEHSILASRLTDRPIRPLFPKGYRNDVQVVITVLSADQENDSDVLGIIAASAALTLSDIPFAGPVGAVRVGYIDGQIVINPTETDLKRQPARPRRGRHGRRRGDGRGGRERAARRDDDRGDARGPRGDADADRSRRSSCSRAAGKPKRDFAAPEPDAALGEAVADFVRPRFERAVNNADKAGRDAALNAVAQRAGRRAGAEVSRPRARRFVAFFEKELKALRAHADPGEGRAPRWARPEGYPPDLVRDGAAATHAWLGDLHARPDAGAQHRDARLARRGADASMAWAPRSPSATSTTTTSRRSASARHAPRVAQDGARSGMARWPSARWCR